VSDLHRYRTLSAERRGIGRWRNRIHAAIHDAPAQCLAARRAFDMARAGTLPVQSYVREARAKVHDSLSALSRVLYENGPYMAGPAPSIRHAARCCVVAVLEAANHIAQTRNQ
jgi:glutathione S-transferase